MAAITFQQAVAADCTNHFFSIPIREWRDTEGNVRKNLHVDPAETEADQRPKQRILRYTDHQLLTIPNHGLYYDAVHIGLLDFIECAAEGGFIRYIQTYRTDVRLVHDAFR